MGAHESHSHGHDHRGEEPAAGSRPGTSSRERDPSAQGHHSHHGFHLHLPLHLHRKHECDGHEAHSHPERVSPEASASAEKLGTSPPGHHATRVSPAGGQHAERATPEHHNCSGHDKRPPSSLKRVAPVEVPIENQLELSPELLRDAYELQRTPAFKEKRERRGSVNCRPGDVIRVRIKEARFPHAADTHIVVKWNHKEVARTPSVLSSSHPVFNFPFSIRLADGDCGLSFEAVRERLFRDSVVGAVDVPLSAVMPGDSEEFWFRIRCANHTHSVQGALLLHVEHYRERYRLKESARRPGGVHGKLRNAPPPEPPREPAPCEDCTTATARRAHGGAAGRAVGDCCGPLAGNHSVRSSESRESAPSSGSHLVSPPRHTPDGRPPRPAPAPAPSTRPDLSVIRLKHPPPLEPPEVPA